MNSPNVKKCPVCDKATHDAHKPFCSARCGMLDLGQWLDEGYRLPIVENDEELDSLPTAERDEEIQ